jgi:hypothetical protein
VANTCFFWLLIGVWPIKKQTVKTAKSPWINEDLKNCIAERDEAKGI